MLVLVLSQRVSDGKAGDGKSGGAKGQQQQQQQQQPMPTDLLSLYGDAIEMSITTCALANPSQPQIKGARKQTPLELSANLERDTKNLRALLTTVATANHEAKRREFTSANVKEALGSEEQVGLLALWGRLARNSALPFIKTLENDTVLSKGTGHGLFQFRHLSFQEALASRGIIANSAEDFPAWTSDDEMMRKHAADAANHNLLSIGGGKLGDLLAGRRAASWNFTPPPRKFTYSYQAKPAQLGDDGAVVLAALLADHRSLTSLSGARFLRSDSRIHTCHAPES